MEVVQILQNNGKVHYGFMERIKITGPCRISMECAALEAGDATLILSNGESVTIEEDLQAYKEFFMNEIGLQHSFFMAMNPPTITHQEKKAGVRKGKPYFYEPAELKAARQLLEAHLGQHVPCEPFQGALRLTTKWCFPVSGKHKNGEYRITKPDTDNLQKLLKDCMTKVGFWEDDAQVASEIAEKFWADVPGIYISIEVLHT